MAREQINNGETGLTVRNKINDNFNEIYTATGKISASSILPAESNNVSNALVTRDSNGSFQCGALSAHNQYFGSGNTAAASSNLGIGFGAPLGKVRSQATSNTAIGQNSQFENLSGSTNVSVGRESLFNNLSGNDNVALGVSTLNQTRGGSRNVGIGRSTLFNNRFGGENVGVGHNAAVGVSINDCSFNVAIGSNALYNVSNNNNVAIGSYALQRYTGGECVAIGGSAGNNLTTGIGNTMIGYAALFNTKTGVYNTAVGYGALNGDLNSDNDQYNTAVGAFALQKCVSDYNVAVGYNCLVNLSAGFDNVGVGVNTIGNTLTGFRNTAMGNIALNTNIAGSENVAIGYGALYFCTSGRNTAIGTLASQNLNQGGIIGALTTSLGYNAGGTITSGTNWTAIGYDAQPTSSNQVRLGNATVTTITWQAGNVSDERDKYDIVDTTLGLNFINLLRPVDYKWDAREDYRPKPPEIVPKPKDLDVFSTEKEISEYGAKLQAHNDSIIAFKNYTESCKLKNIVKDGSKRRVRNHHGFISQQVKQVIQTTGKDFGGFQDHSLQGGEDVMTLGYTEFIGPIVKAIQELSAEVSALKIRLSA